MLDGIGFHPTTQAGKLDYRALQILTHWNHADIVRPTSAGVPAAETPDRPTFRLFRYHFWSGSEPELREKQQNVGKAGGISASTNDHFESVRSLG